MNNTSGPALFHEVLPDGTAAITGALHGIRKIAVPARIGAIPVSRISAHAFEDMDSLREVFLPDGICSLGNFAFCRCSNLEYLSITDSIEEVGDGVIRMCRSLRELRVDIRRGNWRLVRDLVTDSGDMLMLKLRMSDGEAELLFPGYYQEIHEDTHARAIHQTIVGAGYSYRESLLRTGIDFSNYDACFMRIRNTDVCTAGRIALSRLMYPFRLSDRRRDEYLAFLPQAAEALLPYLISVNETRRIRFLVRAGNIPVSVMEEGIRLASKEAKAEICSLLMDAAGRLAPEGTGMESFSLEEI